MAGFYDGDPFGGDPFAAPSVPSQQFSPRTDAPGPVGTDFAPKAIQAPIPPSPVGIGADPFGTSQVAGYSATSAPQQLQYWGQQQPQPQAYASWAPQVGASGTPVSPAYAQQAQGAWQAPPAPGYGFQGSTSPAPTPPPVSFDPFAAPPVVAAPVSPAPVPARTAVTTTDDDWGISWDFAGGAKKAPEAKQESKPTPQVVKSSPAPPQGKTSSSSTTAAAPPQSPSSSSSAAEQEPPSGVLLARVSTRSIFVREWKPCFWVIINHRLWIYRSKTDFKPMDYLHDPFSERIKKCIHLRDNLRVTEMKSKVYPGETRTLYTFGIEYLEDDGGKDLLAKFAAYEYDAVRTLREELDRRVFEERLGSKQQRK